MKRLFQHQYSAPVLSFLGLLVAYWLYAWVVAPVALSRDPDFPKLREEVDSIPLEDLEWKKHLVNLFSEGDWERTSRYSIWKDNFVLLFNDYKEVQNKNSIEINPCTVLFLTGEQGKDDEKLFQEAIILQSTGGAVLEFDGPFNPLAGSKTKFVNGELLGDVTIRSDMKESGPEDDLKITTKSVIFNENQIIAGSDIEFQFGMSQGFGSRLIISLVSSDPRNSKSSKTISRVELLEVKKIYLNTPSNRITSTGEIQYDRFEVTCRGIDFMPDPESNFYWVGTFNTDVNVSRVIEGSYDTLECNQLLVRFAPKPKPNEEPIPNNDLGSLPQLAPLEMLAVGRARIRSPNNNGFLAEGHKLEYNFEKGLLVLDSDLTTARTVKLSLYDGKQWAIGEKIFYTLGQNGQFGELIVPRGGKLRGIMSPEKPQAQQRTFQLEWNDRLEAFPDPGNPELVRCQLFGQMSMNVENLGTMYAKETVIWFKQKTGEAAAPVESPPVSRQNPLIRQVSGAVPQTPALNSSPQNTVRSPNALTGGFQSLTPSHARISKDVRFVTENGVCNVREMNIWFYEAGQEAPPGPQYASSVILSPTTNMTAASPQRSSPSRSFLGGNDSEGSQFELFGDTMDIRVIMQGNSMEIDRLYLNGGGKQVRLEETNPKQGTAPIKMVGTEIRAWNPSSDRSVVQLLGTPASLAKIEGMESALTALDVIFNQQTNQIKINGGGEITSTQLAMSNDLAPSGPSQKKLLVVRWTGGMSFDGTRISFERDVVAMYPLQELYCNVLNLDLDQPVSLIQPKVAQNAKVRRVECLGKVFFTYEDRDQIDSSKRKSILKGENLDQIQLFPETGQFDGSAQGMGQGRLRTTFLDEGGSSNLLVDGTPRTENSPKVGLTKVDLYFYGRVLGNFKLFDATATDSVVCIYCPVPAWDTVVDIENREQLKERDGYRLDCDILEVTKTTDPQTLLQGLELTASGATKIEGKQLFARAESVKFNQLKETVIIEGSGSISAEVHIKRSPDGDYEEAIFVQQLTYNLRTKNWETKNVRATQFLK